MEPNRREFQKQCAFQRYCNTVLHNEACDAHKELQKHKEKEVTFSDMTLEEARQLHSFDEYFKKEDDEPSYEMGGKKITLKLLLDAIRLEQIVQAAAILPHARKHDLLERHACVRADEHLARRACFYAIRQSRRLQHDEGVRLHRIAELDARGERCPQPGDSVVKNLMVEKVQRRRACIQRVLQRCVVYHHRSALSRFAGSPCDSRSIARSTFPFLFSGMLGTFAMRVGLMKAGSNDAARPGSSFSQAVPS